MICLMMISNICRSLAMNDCLTARLTFMVIDLMVIDGKGCLTICMQYSSAKTHGSLKNMDHWQSVTRVCVYMEISSNHDQQTKNGSSCQWITIRRTQMHSSNVLWIPNTAILYFEVLRRYLDLSGKGQFDHSTHASWEDVCTYYKTCLKHMIHHLNPLGACICIWLRSWLISWKCSDICVCVLFMIT